LNRNRASEVNVGLALGWGFGSGLKMRSTYNSGLQSQNMIFSLPSAPTQGIFVMHLQLVCGGFQYVLINK